jgi:hypothetical protein
MVDITDSQWDCIHTLHEVISMDWNNDNYVLPMVKQIQVYDYLKPEGHWRDCIDQESRLPWPESNQYSEGSIRLFLPLLKVVEKKAASLRFMGFSKCRICNCKNGTSEFYWQGWIWPIGLSHYIEEHGVAPTPGFVKFITEESTKVKRKRKTFR